MHLQTQRLLCTYLVPFRGHVWGLCVCLFVWCGICLEGRLSVHALRGDYRSACLEGRLSVHALRGDYRSACLEGRLSVHALRGDYRSACLEGRLSQCMPGQWTLWLQGYARIITSRLIHSQAYQSPQAFITCSMKICGLGTWSENLLGL